MMYEEMAKKLSAPLHIYNCHDDGQPRDHADVYGKEQPGEPVKLVREPTDLYRRLVTFMCLQSVLCGITAVTAQHIRTYPFALVAVSYGISLQG